ncbi:DUF397 domain-containing protein [Nocardiopsis sediminis]|uniref:DUF397 domain-containing protein n=1 Tax=Nocardiopsis sediminis TaxID=1778267 RepID=A0ABV8FVY3_9ACTN
MHPFPHDARWRTSTYTQQQNCVEVADTPGQSALRDTKNRDAATLVFPGAEWRSFIRAVKNDAL